MKQLEIFEDKVLLFYVDVPDGFDIQKFMEAIKLTASLMEETE